jgi:hypothetical protein
LAVIALESPEVVGAVVELREEPVLRRQIDFRIAHGAQTAHLQIARRDIGFQLAQLGSW